MNIAYIVPSLAKKGPVIVAFELAKLMIENGHNVSVFYFDELTENILQFPCPTQKISFNTKINFASYDIVHTHSLRPDFYVFRHKVNNGRTRYISTIHCFVFDDFRTSHNIFYALFFTPLWMFALRTFDVRIVLSKVALTYYKKFWLKDSYTTYIYNSRNVRLYDLSDNDRRQIVSFKGTDTLLGINAILTPRKAVDIAIKALSKLNDVKLFIVGDGKSKADLMTLTKEYNVEDRVFFAGYKEDAYRYIPYYDVYMMPSKSEGFPLALLEAISLKCNAVISDIPIFKEFFTDEEVTFFKLDDVSDCARAITTAMSHSKAEKAYKAYQKKYSPQIFARHHLDVYQSILK